MSASRTSAPLAANEGVLTSVRFVAVDRKATSWPLESIDGAELAEVPTVSPLRLTMVVTKADGSFGCAGSDAGGLKSVR